MCDELGYEAPERIRELLDDILEQRRDLEVLELGCGSGLAGAVLRNRARHLSGIDLSPEMVELARKREIYDELAVAEITAWQAAERRKFDLIAACDTFIYFGDLALVVESAAKLLTAGGRIVFSVERSKQPPFQLTDSGRLRAPPRIHSRGRQSSRLESREAAPGIYQDRVRRGCDRVIHLAETHFAESSRK